MAYFVLFVNFGFNIAATKEISINRDNKNAINEISSSVYISKGILFTIVFFITVILTKLIPNIEGYKELLYLTLWMCLYEFIFPIWFFQGIEKMQYITYISVIIRSIFVILIFLFVKKKTDFLLVPTFNGIGAVVAGMISSYVLFKKYKVRLIQPNYSAIKKLFSNGGQLLLTSIAGIIKDKSNTIIIGLSLGMREVAYYDLADKVVNLFSNMFYTIGNVLFPNYSRNKNSRLIRKILLISFIASLAVYLTLCISLPYIIKIVVGKDMIPAANIFLILGLLIIFRNLSYLVGVVILIGNGYVKEVVINMLYSTLVYLLLAGSFKLINTLNIYTIAISLVLSVTFEFANRWYYSVKFKLITIK